MVLIIKKIDTKWGRNSYLFLHQHQYGICCLYIEPSTDKSKIVSIGRIYGVDGKTGWRSMGWKESLFDELAEAFKG